MAETLKLPDWQNIIHGGWALRRIFQTFANLSPSNRPLHKAGMTVSATQTGSGSEQSVAHGLSGVPDSVLVVPVGAFNGITGEITQGTHTATDAKVTVPNGLKYQVVSILT